MIYLRYATASQEIPLGYFLDSTDGNTEETGLTIANTDIKIWKNGAITLANKNSGGATHISNGIYYATLDATDTNTLGNLVIFVHVSGALTIRLECCVLPANIYDSWIAGTDNQQVDAVQIEGSDATDQIRDSVVDDATRIDASALNTLSGHDPGSQIASQTDISGLNDPSSADIADAVWDEILTAATHNISTSAGRRLRELAGNIIRSETAQGAGTGNNQIQLDSGASATDGAYDPSMICIVNGTGVGQSRLVLQYNGISKTATVDRNWKVNPDATSEFVIYGHPGREHVNEGLAQGGTANTITLNTLASSNNNCYIGQTVFIRSGTGEDQSRIVTAYNGSTKVATVERDWDVTPDTSSGYVMLGNANHILTELSSACMTALNSYDPPTKAELDAGLAGLNDITVSEIIAGITDGSYDLQEMLRIIFAACAGKSDGGGSATLHFRNSADTKNRITATVDSNGNRTAVILDET